MSQKLSKYGFIDRSSPEASARCDRGGEIRKRSELHKEMAYAGNKLVWNGFLVCSHHIDTPNPQSKPYNLRPDPVPVPNPRPDIDALLTHSGAPIGIFTVGVNAIIATTRLGPE